MMNQKEAKKIADKLDIDHTTIHIENFLEELPNTNWHCQISILGFALVSYC